MNRQHKELHWTNLIDFDCMIVDREEGRMGRSELMRSRAGPLAVRTGQSGRLFLWGACWGFLVSSILLLAMRYVVLKGLHPWGKASRGMAGASQGSLVGRGGLYTGILAQSGDLQQAEAVWSTWAMAATKTQVFTTETITDRDSTLPLVTLHTDGPAVTDTSALLGALGHVCDHVDMEQFDWFLLSRDDVYIHVINLKKYLMGLDPQAMHMVGEVGAEDAEGTCSSRAGLALSRTLLNRVCPHLSACAVTRDLPACVEKLTGIDCHNNRRTRNAFQRLGVEEREQLAGSNVDQSQGFSDVLAGHVTFVFPLTQPWLLHRLHEMYLRERLRTKGWTLTLTAVSAEELRSQVYLGYTSSNDNSALCPQFTDYIHLHHKKKMYPGHSCFTTETSSSADRQDIQQIFDAAVFHSMALDGNYGTPSAASNVVLDGYACSSGTNTTDYVIHLIANQDKDGHVGNLTKTRIIHHLDLPVVQTIRSHQVAPRVTTVLGVPSKELNYLEAFMRTWKDLKAADMVTELFVVPFQSFKTDNNNSMADTITSIISKQFPQFRATVTVLKPISSQHTASALHAVKSAMDATGKGAVIFATPRVGLTPKYSAHCRALATVGSSLVSLPLQNHTTADVSKTHTMTQSLQQPEPRDLPKWLLHWSQEAHVVCASSDFVGGASTVTQLEGRLAALPRTLDPSLVNLAGTVQDS